MADTHSFDVSVAEQLASVELAVLLDHFGFWHELNRKAGRNYRNGHYWTYNTLDELLRKFPYWTKKPLRTLLGHLEKRGLTISDQPGGQDRTNHYALTQAGCKLLSLPFDNEPCAQTDTSNLPNGHMEVPEQTHACAQTDTSMCQNGHMVYKDTDAKQADTEQIQSAAASAGEKKGEEPLKPPDEEAPTPPVAAAPPPPEKPAKRKYGDGVLQERVREFFHDNPDEFPKEMIPDFLEKWTAVVQNDTDNPDNNGKELWLTQHSFPIRRRLQKWLPGYLNEQQNHATKNAIYGAPDDRTGQGEIIRTEYRRQSFRRSNSRTHGGT